MDTDEEKLRAYRSENLKKIIEDDFANKKSFIEAVKGSLGDSTISKAVLNTDRGCTSQVARHIEKALGEPPGSLDKAPSEAAMDVYYISIATDKTYLHENIEHLKQDDRVQECSAIFGEYDIRLKVEVESQEMLGVLLDRIDKLAGVRNSKTEVAVKGMHWQKKQNERMDILQRKNIESTSYGIEKFIHEKIESYFHRIKELDKGDQIILRRDKGEMIENHKIISGAKISLHMTRDPEANLYANDRFIEEEEKAIKTEGVFSERIILIRKDYLQSKNRAKLDKAIAIYRRYKEIGSNVRFIFENNWGSGENNPKTFERFNIVDERFVCTKNDNHSIYTISKSPEIISKYKKTFYKNWERSIDYGELSRAIGKSHEKPRFSLEDGYGISGLIMRKINGHRSEIKTYEDTLKDHKEDLKMNEKERSLAKEKIKKNVSNLQAKIKDLNGGDDVILTHESTFLDQHIIIRGARESIKSVRWTYTLKWYYDHNRSYYDKYIEEEKNLIRNGVISQRITFLPDDIENEWENMLFFEEVYQNIGCSMKYIRKNEWTRTHSSKKHERFMIIDKKYACLKRDDETHHAYVIKREPARIEDYINVFEENWDNSMYIEQVKALIG